MATVSIHPPKTPCTKGSLGIAKATLPNICKMPGPPAPFIPTPLPNIGKSGDSPKDYSTSVRIEGNAVAIRGASFGSMGDLASKALGGGLVSMNTHGPTKFIGPGSVTVKIEGKNVHLLGDPMLNNCGPSGSPANSATLQGLDQWDLDGGTHALKIFCKDAPEVGVKFTPCEKEELCAKCSSVNEQAKAPGGLKRHATQDLYKDARREADKKTAQLKGFAARDSPQHQNLGGFGHVSEDCEKELSKKAKDTKYDAFSPDHMQEIQFCGPPSDLKNLRWMSSRPNKWIGGQLYETKNTGFKCDDPGKHTGVEPDCCK